MGNYMVLLAILFVGNVFSSSAQQAHLWSGQERIPEYYDGTEEPPFLIADQNHIVHAFNSQPLDLANPDSQRVIFYRQWSVANGWTFPNDILYDVGGGNMDLLGVTVDHSGRVYLVFQLYNEQIYYAWAFLANAGDPIAWAPPQFLAMQSLSARPGIANIASIATDAGGQNIVIIYSGLQEGNGLYFTHSSDEGLTWSQPYPIYLTGDETMVVTDPKLYAGESGIFHAVWTTFMDSGNGGPGYYASFDPMQSAWSEPMALDTPGIRTPSVTEYHGDVVVSYHHYNVNGNWWRRSSDNGKTWTYPAQISPRHVGTNGAVSFAVDGADTLHAFFGERIDDNNHGMWDSTLIDFSWANPEAVVRGPQIKDMVGGKGFDPRSARAVVSNGNVILVTWGTDGAGGMNGAWYSYKQLNTPELPAMSPPVLAETVHATEILPVVTTMVDGGPTPGDISNNDTDLLQSPQGLQTSIFIGVISVVMLLIVSILVLYITHSRNK